MQKALAGHHDMWMWCFAPAPLLLLHLLYCCFPCLPRGAGDILEIFTQIFSSHMLNAVFFLLPQPATRGMSRCLLFVAF